MDGVKVGDEVLVRGKIEAVDGYLDLPGHDHRQPRQILEPTAVDTIESKQDWDFRSSARGDTPARVGWHRIRGV